MSIFQSISFSGVDLGKLQAQPQRLPIENFRSMRNIQCTQEMREYVAPTAQYIFNYIAEKATSNMCRAVHFNMLVSDNFSNPELVILTTFVLNMAYIKLKNGSFNNVDQAITQCATWLIDRRINFITINNTQLAQASGANLQDVRNAATEYMNEAAQVNQLLANTFTSGPVSANGFGSNNNSNFGGGGFNSNNNGGGFGGSLMTSFGNNGGNGNNGQVMNGFGGNTPVSLTGFGGQINTNANNVGSVITRVARDGSNISQGNRFDNDIHAASTPPRLTPRVTEEKVVQQQNVNAQGVKQPEVNYQDKYFREDGSLNFTALEETNLPWRTSAYQKHALAYDSRLFAKVNKLLPGKKANEYSVISSLKKVEPMDRSTHSLAASEHFLNQVIPVQLAGKPVTTRAEFKEETLKNVANNLKEVRSESNENDYVRRLDEFRTIGHLVLSESVSSVQEAITVARLSAMANMPGEFGTYQLEFNLVKEIPLYISDIAEVVKLGNYKTFLILAANIRGIIEDVKASQSLRTAMVQLNAYLAKKFIEHIRFYLSIDEYTESDSFIDDAMEIIDDIGVTFGVSYKEALLSSQVRFIEANLNFGDALENIVPDKILQNEKTEPVSPVALLPITVPCLLTCSEFLNSEYSLVTPRGIGAMFTPGTTSDGLFGLIEECVTKPFSEGLQTNIKRFFIATLDDQVYEANIGLAKDKAPLLIMKLD
jgi:hypothetical protein